MKRSPISAAVLLLLTATPGCLWLDPVAREVDPVAIDRPSKVDPSALPTTPRAVERPRPAVHDVDLGGLPQPTAEVWSPVEPFTVRGPGALGIAAAQWTHRPTAQVTLSIAHREVAASRIGIARLTAEMLADAPLAEGGRPSLRRTVENAGGTLDIESDASSTRFSLTLPAGTWRDAVDALGLALAIVPSSPERLDATRLALIAELGERWADDPLAAAVERVRSIEFAGLPLWLGAVEDARLDDVVDFHRGNYRPGSTVCVLATPDATPEDAVQYALRALHAFASTSTSTLPDPNTFVAPSGGVYWAEGDPPARLAVVVELPPSSAPAASVQWLLAHCLIGSEVDGRIPRALLGVAPGAKLSKRIVAEATRRRIELLAEVDPARATELVAAVRDAVHSLATLPPDEAEILRAASRAKLRLMLDLRDPRTWAAELARGLHAGALPDALIPPKGRWIEIPGPESFDVLLADLADPTAVELAARSAELGRAGAFAVLLGAELPGLANAAHLPDARILPAQRELATADLEAQAAQTQAVLERAVLAVGGPAPLLGLRGYRTASITRSGRGPEAVDEEWFTLDGRFRRLRHVLESSIETVVGPDGASERCDGHSIAIPEAEAEAWLDRARRHPLVLLGDWLRGASRYRLVSERVRAGRRFAVLDRVDLEPGQMRLFVDVESGLIRSVIAREDRPNGPVWLREEWRDYRAAGRALHAPHHLTTLVDGGPQGSVTTYSSFSPVAPEAEWLQPGGPTR